MNIQHYLLTAIIVLLLSGCASGPKKPKLEQYFSTNVTAEGVKQFSLAITLPSNKKNKNAAMKRGRGEKPDKAGRGDRKPKADNRADDGRFVDLLERHLEVQQYCQMGYEITEQYRQHGYLTIQGQCNETAVQ